jgi:hypothetical protein
MLFKVCIPMAFAGLALAAHNVRVTAFSFIAFWKLISQ